MNFNAYFVLETLLNAQNNFFISLKTADYYFLYFIGEEIEAIGSYWCELLPTLVANK